MGLSGLEPPTSRLSGVRSNRLSYKPSSPNTTLPHNQSRLIAHSFRIRLLLEQNQDFVRKRIGLELFTLHLNLKLLRFNGDGEIRTLDPLLARQVLSQLSYTPVVARNYAPSQPIKLGCSLVSYSSPPRTKSGFCS